MSEPDFEMQGEQQIPRGRSSAIEILCVLGFLAALYWVPQGLGEAWRQGLSWSSFAAVFFPVASVVCLVGFWRMRRWAVYAFAGLWVANQIVLLLVGHWSALTVPLPVLLIIVGFKDMWRMS
jgi:hypothetical protein